MDRETSLASEGCPTKRPEIEKGRLRPLSSIARRSISPSAKVTLDTMPNAFTTLMQGNGLDKQWAEAEESEKAAVGCFSAIKFTRTN